MAGNFSASQALDLEQLSFPEFHRHRILETSTVNVFNSDCRYDIIIGRDVLQTLGVNLDFKDNIMTWDEAVVAMHPYQ